VVAVSGGPDSVCLLHILVRLRKELNLELHVAHLNHQLRGSEAETDAQYVSQLAQGLGITATIERRDVKSEQSRLRTSLEESARIIRYTFLAQVAESIGTNLVAVGHTSDDHIETILMHLIRGSGTRGLRGLQPISQWPISGASLMVIRPLLQVTCQETADYCHDHQLKPRIDASNLSLSPLRNRIRHHLLPQLKHYNPRVDEALLRTAHIAGDDLAFIEQESARLWGTTVQRQGDTIVFDRAGFLELPLALQRHLLRTAIEKLLTNLRDIETRHIEAVLSALNKPAGKRLNLPGGLVFTIEYNRYLLGADAAALAPFPPLKNAFALKIPGETRASGWRVTATTSNPTEVKLKPQRTSFSPFIAYFDLDKIGHEVVVRSHQPGDRFQPLGMGRSKKLGEFMIDIKIPRAWRQCLPIVCSPQHIIWVVSGQIDDRVKVTESTRRVLNLQFERDPVPRAE
jgi:tRNA(Ile)-lysidine synthase